MVKANRKRSGTAKVIKNRDVLSRTHNAIAKLSSYHVSFALELLPSSMIKHDHHVEILPVALINDIVQSAGRQFSIQVVELGGGSVCMGDIVGVRETSRM